MIKYHAQFLLDKEKGKDTAKLRYRVKWDNNTKIVAFSVGYRVNIEKWSTEVQRCKNNTTHGKKKVSASVINKKLQEYENTCNDLFAGYYYENKIPEKETFKNDFNKKVKSKSTKIKKSEEIKESQIKNGKDNFFDLFNKFMKEESLKNQWTDATRQKLNRVKKHLFEFDKNLTFDNLTEEKLIKYQYYMHEVLRYKNSTLLKNLSFVKWYLKWSVKKGFNKNNTFEFFKPKLKKTQKKIIFLTQEELNQVKEFKIPKQKKYLERVRDVFLFQCFTGLRFSDVANLKKSDVKDDHIVITVIKTTDTLIIELNSHSKTILDKYANMDLEDDKALPTITNQKSNDYLKELMKLVGIDEPIRETYFIGNQRFDEITPKHALISTHAGRRTFICTALSLGIPPQVVMKWTGHSDYKSMKPYIDIADSIRADAMKKFELI